MVLIFLLFLAVPQGKQPFKPDIAIVADEVDQFDGTVIRNIYCFKMLPDAKGELKLKMIGNMASHPENIRVTDNVIKWKTMEIRPNKLYTYKGAPDPIREYVRQCEDAEKLWFGSPMHFNPMDCFLNWCCP